MRKPLAFIAPVTITCVVILSGCGGPRNRDTLTFSHEEVFRSAGWTEETFGAWEQYVDLDDQAPTYSDLGAYPIGNGRVFGIVGLSLPLGTVQDMLGPTYQKVAGLMGSVMPAVLMDGEPILPTRQSTAWVAPCGVVRSRWEGDAVQVDLLQTVPPEIDAALTLIMVTNVGDKAVDVTLALQSSMPTDEETAGELVFTRGDARMRAGFAGADTLILHRSVIPGMPEGLEQRIMPLGSFGTELEGTVAVGCPLGPVRPEESVGKLAYLTFARDPGGERQTVEEIESAGWELFEDSHQWWQRWHDRTLQVEGAGEELDQFMAIQKYICRVQQAETGGYSPMHKYTQRWIRDSNGPIAFLLDCGDFDSVDRDLSYHFAGCALQKRIFNNMPLNLDANVESPPQIDWSEVPAPKAEIASFVILQNWWYWQHTGEIGQLEKRWDYLRRALEAHRVDAQGRLPFHGDETYRFPGYELHQAEPGSCPDYVHLTLRSADSAFEYVAAAEAMAQMAEALGRDEAEVAEYRRAAEFVREATERLYWQEERGYYAPAASAVSGELYRYPFANICLRPLWIGYAQPDDRQVRNVLSALSHLYRPDIGTSKLTPACGYYVGMTPGYVLAALSAIDHPEAGQALEGLLVAAEPSGGFAEMNRPDDLPSRDVWGLHRVRPWEGGINGSAVLQYLTGFEPRAQERLAFFRPNLPGGVHSMTVRNLRVGDANLRLEAERAEHTVIWRVTCEEAADGVMVAQGVPRPLASFDTRPPILRPGESRAFERPLPSSPVSLRVAERPFDYGPSDVPSGAAVLLTWSAEVAEQVRETEGQITVLDTRIAWPAQYLR
ncbi:MAG: hypothetical protein ACP5KN_18510, partial [Armatimonadota bacterium]